jgi:type IV secretory pathway VirB10-like protein
MSETPKFTVIDRRKMKAEEEQENPQPAAPAAEAPPPPPPEPGNGPAAGPRLVVSQPEAASDQPAQPELPPAPTAQESTEQKTAYDASAQRLEDLVRAQNPAVGPQPAVSFEHLVQQFYVSAMIQMGAGAQEGQRPRIDILGARQTIDLLGVLAEKTRGNLSDAEDRMLQTVLFETRMAFMELTSMITLQSIQPPAPPPPGKH